MINVMVSLEGEVFINDSEVVTADIEGSNGVIHVIDAVLVPEDVVLETEEEQETFPYLILE
ncbi:MAG: fasciclin domain-containing protein [Bacillota bacterium]|nr:fasciclin domain-containing protein [Bacillota bacterium]